MPDAPTPENQSQDAPDEGDEPQAANKAAHAGGFTLDLSSGPSSGHPESWRRKRKQASPILTKIVDLTAPKPAPAPPKPPAPKAKAKVKPQVHASKPPREDPRGRGKKPGGATLADLLDEETLARLRREE